MAQQYKIDRLNELKEHFDNSKNYIFNNYLGLNVEKITNLRDKLREKESKFVVIKNNLVKRIFKEKEMPEMGDNLIGATAVAFANDNVNEILKILFDFTKDSTLQVKGGYINNDLFDIQQLTALSKLPGREQLIAMLMSTLNAPIQNFVFACNDIIGRLVRVVKAVGDSKK